MILKGNSRLLIFPTRRVLPLNESITPIPQHHSAIIPACHCSSCERSEPSSLLTVDGLSLLGGLGGAFRPHPWCRPTTKMRIKSGNIAAFLICLIIFKPSFLLLLMETFFRGLNGCTHIFGGSPANGFPSRYHLGRGEYVKNICFDDVRKGF